MKAFLSHSSADNVLAQRIFRFLRDQPVSVWFDRVELRPGDSFVSRISSAIDDSDFLFVLVTPTAASSSWVQKEIEQALNHELAGKSITVVALSVDNSPVPAALSDKIFIPITSGQAEFHELISAVFRDSFILDVPLAGNLDLQRSAVRTGLYDYIRSRYSLLRARVLNDNFNNKIAHIIGRTTSTLRQDLEANRGKPDALLLRGALERLESNSRLFDIQLPLFWTTLADCLSGLCNAGFADMRKNLETIETLDRAVSNTLLLTLYSLGANVHRAITSDDATAAGYPDIAQWLRHIEQSGFENLPSLDRLIPDLLESWEPKDLHEMELIGDKEVHVLDTRLLVPLFQDSVHDPRPLFEILPVTWFPVCVPQVINRKLVSVVYREGKPLHELTNKIGFSLRDYTAMAPA
jgi:hypothetical protein